MKAFPVHSLKNNNDIPTKKIKMDILINSLQKPRKLKAGALL
jgi:hypothetical protein